MQPLTNAGISAATVCGIRPGRSYGTQYGNQSPHSSPCRLLHRALNISMGQMKILNKELWVTLVHDAYDQGNEQVNYEIN